MSHCHDHHHPKNYNKAFAIGVLLNLIFVVIEVIFGLLADSLALIADAGHNLSDVLSLLLAWGASALATKKATIYRTYGFRRVTIFASLLSAIMLIMTLGIIAWEAIERFNQPISVDSSTIIIVAGIGAVINTATALLFISGSQHDLNIKGAYLHMAADAGVSVGVVIAGILMAWTNFYWIDPVISIMIVIIIIMSTWGLFRDSLDLAIDAVPKNIKPEEVKSYLQSLPGVVDLHDLHIWATSTTEIALTVHLIIPNDGSKDQFLESERRGREDVSPR